MRNLFALLALLGVVGLGFGVFTIFQGGSGPAGVPFAHETYGGPGSMLAGLLLLLGALYLRSVWPRSG